MTKKFAFVLYLVALLLSGVLLEQPLYHVHDDEVTMRRDWSQRGGRSEEGKRGGGPGARRRGFPDERRPTRRRKPNEEATRRRESLVQWLLYGSSRVRGCQSKTN